MKSNWITATIDDVCTVVTDGAHNSPKSVEQGHYMASVKDFTEFGFDFSNCKQIGEEDYEKLRNQGCVPEKNDILVGKDGARYFEDIIIYKQDERPALLSSIAILRADCRKITPEFLYYTLKSPAVRKDVRDNYGSGSAIPRIVLKDFKRMPFSFPSIEEQRKITNLCSAIDAKIQINNAINENLQQQMQALFKLWFVEYSPFDSVEPKEWENVNLEEITSLISRGIAPKYSDDSAQMVINQKCIRNHMIDLSLARAHTPKTINEKWLRFGDLLINSTGDGTLGRTAQVWFQPQNLTVDSHVTIVRPIKENLIFYIGLWGMLHEREIESLHTGSTGQTELPRERVKALELLLPDDEILDHFNTLVAPMADAIVSNQEESNRLAALRNVLLPKLMSGEIDVSTVQL